MYDVLGSRTHCDCYLHGCPCGYYGDPRRACTCAPRAIGRYQAQVCVAQALRDAYRLILDPHARSRSNALHDLST
jgi:predicted ATPase with chaperone activity